MANSAINQPPWPEEGLWQGLDGQAGYLPPSRNQTHPPHPPKQGSNGQAHRNNVRSDAQMYVPSFGSSWTDEQGYGASSPFQVSPDAYRDTGRMGKVKPPGKASGKGDSPPMPWNLLAKEQEERPQHSMPPGHFEQGWFVPDGIVSQHQMQMRGGEEEWWMNSQQGKQQKAAPPENSVSGSESKQPVKTIMIRNIPRTCSRHHVLDAVRMLGFGDVFNFCHLPTRRKKDTNAGYAFVGFDDPVNAARFREAIHGYRFPLPDAQPCEAEPARSTSGSLEFFDRASGWSGRKVRGPNMNRLGQSMQL